MQQQPENRQERIRDLLHWDQLISTIEARAAFSLGRVPQPVRNMLTIEEGKRVSRHHAGGGR